MVQRLSAKELPQCLLDSEELSDLNDDERRNFSARLDYITEIHTNGRDYLDFLGSYEDVADYLDVAEQDLFINLSPGQPGRALAPWLVHSSWTFDMTPSGLLRALPENCIEALSKTEIGFDCNEAEFRKWLEKQIGCLRILLDRFYDAKKFADVVAHLIGMDISLCALLLGISKQRMNPTLSS